MHIRSAIIAMLVLEAGSAHAQVAAVVSGVVVEGPNRLPIAAASVTVLKEAGELVTGAVTDSAGRFSIAGLPEGEYVFRTDAPGHAPAQRNVLIGRLNSIYNLGEIAVARLSPAQIEEVLVSGDAIVDTPPGVSSFSMENNIARSGGSVLDAVKSLPGVAISEDGQVSLRGSDRVPILIDGKASALTGFGNQSSLDSIPAANIERIEIINNPSARLDAAGMAGIINIVYKKESRVGWHGDLGVALGMGAMTKRKPDIPSNLGSYTNNPKITPSLNLSYSTGDIAYFLQSEILLQEDLPNNEFTTRFYDDGREIRSQIPENREQVQYVVKTGADWQLGADTLRLAATFDYEHHEDRAQIPFVEWNTREQLRYWFWREDEVTGFANIDLGYTRAFVEPGHQLGFNLQYTRGWEDEAYFLNEVSPIRTGTDATHLKATEHTLPFSVDYVRPLQSGRIELGSKLQARWIPITYDVNRGQGSVIYPGIGDRSEWQEDIYAAYVNYVHEQTHYAVEGGVRLEQTEVSYELPPGNIYYPQSDRYDYLELFPNVRLTYNLGQRTSLSAFYNRRVDRPGEPELRIFPKYDDPELLKVGNPYLRPQFTRSYELAARHEWDQATLSVAVYHRSINDPFIRVFAIDPTITSYDVVNRIYQNVGSARNEGLELLATLDLTPSWQLSGSINVYRNTIDRHVIDLLFPVRRQVVIEPSEDSTWDVKLNSGLLLPYGISMQASVLYYGDKNIPQGSQDARSSLDLAFSRKFMGDRGELILSATDVFNGFGLRQRIDGAGFDAVYENFYETQTVSLGFKYSY